MLHKGENFVKTDVRNCKLKNSICHHEHEGFNARMSELGVDPIISIADRQGIGMLAHAEFSASEGTYSAAPCLMINLCTAHVGRMRRVGCGPDLEGVLRPGTVAIALPNTPASGYWSKTRQLGIAVNLDALSVCGEEPVTGESLLPAASRLHNDALLTSVMTALWHDAEFHGMSAAFFEQGIHVLLRRLVSFEKPACKKAAAYPLRGRRLQSVLELIESRIADDIRVSELAALAEQDVRSFTRSFFLATGYSPYAYFTFRRMECARNLLCESRLPVTQIALQVGYINPGKFSAAFRRTYGLTPGAWKKAQGLLLK